MSLFWILEGCIGRNINPLTRWKLKIIFHLQLPANDRSIFGQISASKSILVCLWLDFFGRTIFHCKDDAFYILIDQRSISIVPNHHASIFYLSELQTRVYLLVIKDKVFLSKWCDVIVFQEPFVVGCLVVGRVVNISFCLFRKRSFSFQVTRG